MKFSELVEQASTFLQRTGRITYRALKREFDLDEEMLEDLKDELIDAKRVASDENGKVLVWSGATPVPSSTFQVPRSPQPPVLSPQPLTSERRQITVLFCDLVGSTILSSQLDPEELREVVRSYQQTCGEIIARYHGHIAQYLGDGILVYFGYPTAHEDDARRAVRTGLEIIATLGQQETGNEAQDRPVSLQVRLGVHTGLVVIGEMGGGGRTEQLALGETPNIAARLQSLAEPNTVLVSAATQQLIAGQFECQPFGSHLLKGFPTPIAVYHVQGERQGLSPLAGKETLTPLVGREQEVGLLLDRWGQTKEGRGQVILLSGEPGIGKSRLTLTLKEHVTQEGSLLYEARCSPYHQHSALYPLIEVMQRTLLFTRQDSDEQKIAKLTQALALYDMQDALPLFTALLSLPTPAHYPPLSATPQKQKERTFQALLQMMVAQAERQATASVWEDLHWADPSSLEFLSLLIEQLPTTKLLLVLTFRPEFTPPWKPRSHLSQLVLNRLGKKQVEAMIEQAAGTTLPPEVVEQIRLKTDGVPLFVEELTKSVLESVGTKDVSPLPLTIPATLQEALLARLDRLSDARQVAQLGATLGREFSHELLQAVAPLNETDLHTALAKLVEAEILYQRGVGEQTRYFFKHALIQDTAYQSLLKSTRLQYHQQIAKVLEERFPDLKANQPEMLAHHYTEANLIEQAVPYWQQAGKQAIQRSANREAIGYLMKGLTLLETQPEDIHRIRRELDCQTSLGIAWIAAKGWTAPEVGQVYTQALRLCRQLGDMSQMFSVQRGLWEFHQMRGELQIALALANELLNLAQESQNPDLLVEAHSAQGQTLLPSGNLLLAQEHLQQGLALYEPRKHRAHAFLYGGYDPGVAYRSFLAWNLWLLGYPDQALKHISEMLAFLQEFPHPYSLAFALNFSVLLHQLRREARATREQAEEIIAYCRRHDMTDLEWGTIQRGWALAEQGQAEGAAQIRQGLAVYRTMETEIMRPYFLSLLTEVCKNEGEMEQGLATLLEAFALTDRTGERWCEAELYRLKGELTLQKFNVQGSAFQAPNTQHLTPNVQTEVEGYFLKAIQIAQKQQAKSWELRTSTSLARLWQRQGKQAEAYNLLSNVYSWFTEGFDTKDLQEAKALLEEL